VRGDFGSNDSLRQIDCTLQGTDTDGWNFRVLLNGCVIGGVSENGPYPTSRGNLSPPFVPRSLRRRACRRSLVYWRSSCVLDEVVPDTLADAFPPARSAMVSRQIHLKSPTNPGSASGRRLGAKAEWERSWWPARSTT
jgi:hypothetical protein